MGLLQRAVETYDAHAHLAGEVHDGHETLAPVAHTTRAAQFEITVNEQGGFEAARVVDKSEPRIVIPATEASDGRSGTQAAVCPHPLCDKLGYYLAAESGFIVQLEAWANSEFTHPKLGPILQYVKAGTIAEDLLRCGCVKPDKNGALTKKDLDGLVRWRVVGLGEASGPCWEDRELMKQFTGYYLAQKDTEEKSLCMVSGGLDAVTDKHPGVIYGKTKLISANDSSNFTYRGRFMNPGQAATVSYAASQKAHNALRWLAAEQGVRMEFGGRTFLCWNPQGKRVCHAAGPFRQSAKPPANPTDYKQELRRTLEGYKSELPERNAGVVIAAFDFATTGRLSLTYYNELMGSDFLQRLHDWDEHCCWWGWDFENRCFSIQSPPLWQIVKCAFGSQREEKKMTRLVVDGEVMRLQMQRLVSCRVDRAKLPLDMERALVERASTPISYEAGIRSAILSAACAVIRKYHYDHFGEVLNMELEKEREDRSYQYGRLLAVLEKVERDTYEKDEQREPNAIRLQSQFCMRPLGTAAVIEQQLERAYFPRLKPGSRAYYKSLIGKIMERIHECPKGEWNKPLEDTYLMGYYLQRQELYQKKNDETAGGK